MSADIAGYFAEWRDLYGTGLLVGVAGLCAGALFGVAAERSDFCTRSAFSEIVQGSLLKPQVVLVLFSMLFAAVFTFAARHYGLVDLSAARETSLSVSFSGILFGCLLFGAGMAYSRGCISRLVILFARGNLRALVTLCFLAVFSLAAISGILAHPRLFIAGLIRFEVSPVLVLFSQLVWLAGIIALIWYYRRHISPASVFYGAGIALMVPLAFFITSVIGQDDFDPVAVEGLRFIQPVADSLSYIIYATALSPKFGSAMLLGVFAGGVVSAVIAGRWRLEGFAKAPSISRYLVGSFLMAGGGSLAGGCSIGWLLTSGAAVAVAAPLAAVGLFGGYLLAEKFALTAMDGPV